MKRKYAAFDIEIARVLPDGEGDWKAYRPLGITCAAIALSDREELLIVHDLNTNGQPADQLGRQTAQKLVDRLSQMVSDGYTVLTWNGLGFDFDVLAEESQCLEKCSWLALNHVDMMFHLLCLLGYGIGLDRAAKAMGLSGKPEGMSGALAPRLWAAGQRQEVLDYVAQDARTTLELAQVCEVRGYLRWIAHSGNIRTVALPQGWLTVTEAMTLPEPDTSWMSDPWPRSKFTGWMVNPSNPSEVSVTLSKPNWRAILDILHEYCQHHGEEWIQWQQSIGQVIQTAMMKADPARKPGLRRIEAMSGVKCRNSGEHSMVFLFKGKEGPFTGTFYLCLDCGAIRIDAGFDDFDSDVSNLSKDMRARALKIIQSDPTSKTRLLKSEDPCVFRPRVERGNPYTAEELEEMEAQEMGRRMGMLEEGEYDYDEHGNPITDVDYYLP